MVSMFPWPWSIVLQMTSIAGHGPYAHCVSGFPWEWTWPMTQVHAADPRWFRHGSEPRNSVFGSFELKQIHVQRYIDNIRLNYTCFAQATLGARMHYGHPAAWICERAPTKISGLMDRNWGSDHTGRIYGSKWWFMDRSSSPTPSPMGQSISTLKPPQRWKGTMDLYGGNWCFMMFPLVAARGCCHMILSGKLWKITIFNG